MLKRHIITTLMLLPLLACTDDVLEPVDTREQLIPVRLTTRASDDEGRQIGLYMVYGLMKPAANYIDNMLVNSKDGLWMPEQTIYWKDHESSADFIGYAPYTKIIDDARAYKFDVKTNQTTKEQLDASDLLWNKVTSQQPTNQHIDLTLKHILSRVVVNVVAGEGFAEGELENGTLSVVLNGMRVNAAINLYNGSIAAEGEPATIIPYKNGDLQFEAIIIPQPVKDADIVTVTWNGNTNKVRRTITFTSGKRYTINVTLKKSKGGINVGISDWDDDGEDFGGTVS